MHVSSNFYKDKTNAITKDNFNFRCQNGWKGSSCDECMELPGCLHGSCEKHNGDKIPNSCHCEDGWMGHLCDQPICAKGCNMSHAHCTKVRKYFTFKFPFHNNISDEIAWRM